MGLLTRRRPLLHFCLLILLSLQIVFAADNQKPKVERTEFKGLPVGLQYFPDSEDVLTSSLGNSKAILHRSHDAGKTWKQVDEIQDDAFYALVYHPSDKKAAVLFTTTKRHWMTKNRGKDWEHFKTPGQPISWSFHATDPDKVILTLEDGSAHYTKDRFKSLKRLRDSVSQCIWAKEQELFTTGEKDEDKNRILCIAAGQYSRQANAKRLLISDDYFETEHEPKLEKDRTVPGITVLVNVKAYTLAARQAEGTDEMALYVSRDSKVWHRAHFGEHKLSEGAYTALESTNYSLRIDVKTETPQAGVLFWSNSEGQNFVKSEGHINRIREGFIDFERIANIQGIMIANIVENYEAIVRSPETQKRLTSKISFDDGRRFGNLKAGDKNLHLHGFTEGRNSGRVFSSPAPGLVMGVGNTGDYLEAYPRGDLYVSTDAGQTWKKALDGPHKYEFGDSGTIFLAISDSGDATDGMTYSLNYGKDWVDFDLGKDDKDQKIKPFQLTTTPDSTSPKFALVATSGSGSDMRYWVYSIDFSDFDLPKCKDKDFETWKARLDENNEPQCIMGNTQSFQRRKADAKCFVKAKFEDPEPKFDRKSCACTTADFECDSGFYRTNSDPLECRPESGRLEPPEGACKGGSSDETFKGTSGIRKIPGNACHVDDGGKDLTKDKNWSCEAATKPANGTITTEKTEFSGDQFRQYYYLERAESSEGDDETVVALTDDLQLYISHNHGKKWEPILEDDDILDIFPNRNHQDSVYFITRTNLVHYSKDRGKNIHKFKAPGIPATGPALQALRFHPEEPDWLIWTSCNEDSSECQPKAFASTKNGDSWDPLLRSVGSCEFVWNKERKNINDKLIYCIHEPSEATSGRKVLSASDDFFEHHDDLFQDVIAFATMSEFIVVATKDDVNKDSLKLESSVDGSQFAHAKFPHGFNVSHDAYTVLDSSTHAIFLHVTTYHLYEQAFGSLLKSNSNGTSFVSSINAVNRNAAGYVDFEKMLGLEGVAIVNVVDNVDDVVKEGGTKRLKSMMTHNDGGEWDYITPPKTDAEGNDYKCSGSTDKCSLHLHGYTERRDPRDTFSSASAVGVMIGVGNVGEYLDRKKEADTFISRDGGFTWKTAKNGQYMWEFGDQGSVIVLVEEDKPTKDIYYTLNEGESWDLFQFSDEAMRIEDITTVPSDNSLNFLLWGKDSAGSNLYTINLDFGGLFSRLCDLDVDDPEAGDYELWTPKHGDGGCIFGHKAQYYRKKLTSTDCYNGPKISRLHKKGENCECTRSDFECDYNFERQIDGTCRLVEGLEARDPAEICKTDPDAFEYYDVTGYRRLPLSTCESGKQMDAIEAHPCPGKETEFAKKHSISGAGLFFAIVIPICVAGAAGYWVYRRYEGKFGRIQLGSSESTMSRARGSTNWLAIPVMVVSAAATAVMAVPMILGSVARHVRERLGRSRRSGGAYAAYTSRGSFARGRGDYTAVAAESDERDLLGEESDDEA